MRRAILLALALAACGGDDSIERVDPDRLRILAGDGQVAPVVTADDESLALLAENVLPDTLIARLEGDTTTASASITAADPLMASVVFPAGTVVEYVVSEDGCGRPFITSVTPDTAGEVRTLWERPAGTLGPRLEWHGDVWGARCEMEARAKVGTEFTAETTFVATFTPGEPRFRIGYGGVPFEDDGPVRFGRSAVTDVYDNPVPWVFEATCCLDIAGTFEDYPTSRSFDLASPGVADLYVIDLDGDTVTTGTVEVIDEGGGTLSGVLTLNVP